MVPGKRLRIAPFLVAGSDEQLRNFLFVQIGPQRQIAGRAERAEHQQHVVIVDQFAGLRIGQLGIGVVVVGDEPDLAAIDAAALVEHVEIGGFGCGRSWRRRPAARYRAWCCRSGFQSRQYRVRRPPCSTMKQMLRPAAADRGSAAQYLGLPGMGQSDVYSSRGMRPLVRRYVTVFRSHFAQSTGYLHSMGRSHRGRKGCGESGDRLSSSFRGARSASPESIAQHSRWWNGFRARRLASPRNDERVTPHPRGARRRALILIHAPSKAEGAGKTGCALHPRSRVQCAHGRKTHTSIQVKRKQPGFPCAMVYDLYVLSLVTGFVATITGEISAHRLDASIGAPGPHDFAVRFRTRSFSLSRATGVHRFSPQRS